MSKQDRQGVRTINGLEQKYQFGREFAKQDQAISKQSQAISTQSMTLSQFISYATTALANAVKKAGDTMSGVLDMSGNKITGVATPSNANDVANKSYVDAQDSAVKTYVDTNFAPSGYGLGNEKVKELTSADNINNIRANGWYAWTDSKPQNAPINYSIMRVWGGVWSGTGNYYVVQELYTGNQNYGNVIMRRSGGTNWREWEYENPPMMTNIEYRTVDRINGKAVYKKADSDGKIMYRLDGETEWKYEAVSMKLLWTNASPTSSFAAQTVSLTLKDYEFVMIESELGSTFCKVGNSTVMFSHNSYYPSRRTVSVSTSGVTFGEGLKYTSCPGDSVASDKNAVCIPRIIYGFKGVG